MSPSVMYYRAFNTGNPYTKHGQRIGFAVLTDHSIVFHDVDRMIDGYIPAEFKPVDNSDARVRQAYLNMEIDYWSVTTALPYEVFMHISNKCREYAVQHAPDRS